MLKLHRDILQEFGGIGKKSKIILFGSVARGNYRLDSDIDLAVVTDDEKVREESRKIADGVLAKYGKIVSIKYFNTRDFTEKKKRKDRFVTEVLKGKVIYGGG